MSSNLEEEGYPKIGSWVVRASVPVKLRPKWGGIVTAVFDDALVITRKGKLEAYPAESFATYQEIQRKRPSPALLTGPQERVRHPELPYEVARGRDAAYAKLLMGEINAQGERLP